MKDRTAVVVAMEQSNGVAAVAAPDMLLGPEHRCLNRQRCSACGCSCCGLKVLLEYCLMDPDFVVDFLLVGE